MASQPTVAVIGLGALGLVTLKNLLEQGFEATGFDQNAYLGGLWQYVPRNKVSVLESTVVNISKERGCFTDFPFPEEISSHPTAGEVHKYLLAYAKNFNLEPRTKLNTKVVGVRRDDKLEKWRVTFQAWDSMEETELFDKVVVANGAELVPKIPSLAGSELFQGQIIHSIEYKQPSAFKNKRVFIVGISNSAADTATSLVGVASKIYLSHNRGSFVLPRRVADGAVLDHPFSYRKTMIQYAMTKWTPGLSQLLGDAYVRGIQQKVFNVPSDWPIYKAPPLQHHVPIISDLLIPGMRSGDIVSVNLPTKVLGSSTIEVEGGDELEIDVIIWCTGYYADYSLVGEHDPLTYGMLSGHNPIRQKGPTAQSGKPELPNLYRGIFSLEHPHSLAFIGALFFPEPAFQIFDLASMAVAQLWKHPTNFPSNEEMLKSVEQHKQWANALAERGAFNPRLVEAGSWVDWADRTSGACVGEKLGYTLAGWKFWLQDRAFCNLLMDGLYSPHIYRLFNSNGKRKSWDGARDAIEKVNKSVEAGTSQKTTPD